LGSRGYRSGRENLDLTILHELVTSLPGQFGVFATVINAFGLLFPQFVVVDCLITLHFSPLPGVSWLPLGLFPLLRTKHFNCSVSVKVSVLAELAHW